VSEENVEAIRTLYDHLSRTRELNREDYAPGATFDASRLAGFGFYAGFDEFYAAWRQYRDTFDEWWIEVDDLRGGQGGRVFAAIRDGGRMKASGAEVRQRLFHVWGVRSGKTVAWAVFLDRADALEAAGLRE
jgi:hypothetical protein